MRSYSRKRKNNIIIGTLCGVMLLMVVGYAAFASQLNIKGTSGISSNWDIEITNIRGGNPGGGDAYDISEPTYTRTTATFNTGLKTPDTERMYEVEVTNKGTLTGLVTIANLSCGDNDAIGCGAFDVETKYFNPQWGFNDELTEEPNGTGFEQGKQDYSDIAFTLAPGEKHYIYVAVYYEDVESQPENLSANINLELTYEQAVDDGNGNIVPNRYFTATFEKGENIVSIGENSASCKAPTNKENANAGCSIVLPQIKASAGYKSYWSDEKNNKIGLPGESYTINKDTVLVATAEKMNIGDEVKVKGLDCNFNILSIDGEKARLLGNCIVNRGYSYNASADGDIPVAFENSMLYQGLLDGTSDWKTKIQASGGDTSLYKVDAPTIEELAQVGKLVIQGQQMYFTSSETPSWLFGDNFYLTKSIKDNKVYEAKGHPKPNYFDLSKPNRVDYGGNIRPILEIGTDNLYCIDSQ